MTPEERYKQQKNKQNKYDTFQESNFDTLDNYILAKIKCRENEQLQNSIYAELKETIEKAIKEITQQFQN